MNFEAKQLVALFTKVAGTLSVEKLKKLKGDGAFQYAKKNGKVLGEGRTRVVSDLGSAVLKMAKNPVGVKGNVIEYSASGSKFAPKVLKTSTDLQWIVVEKARELSEGFVDGAFKANTGYGHFDVMDIMGVGSQGLIPSHSRPTGDVKSLKTKHESLLKTNRWYKELFKFCLEFKMDPYELHANNLGLAKGNLVITDLGPSFGNG